MRTDRAFLAGAAAAALLLGAQFARAYCRTTTCPIYASFSPSPTDCFPPNFAQYCAALPTPAKILPLWWRNHCLSYDLSTDAQGNVSDQLSYATAAQIAADSFAKWTSSYCPTSAGPERVSVDVSDLGPVSCTEVNYNSDQPNQHIIVFRDQGFGNGAADGSEASASTLGLTTVTFDQDTGEIYDADMEINTASSPNAPLSTGDSVPANGYDLQSIITHEAGHFLGLAHSGDFNATMYATYEAGSTSKRILSADDQAGICAIYPPDGTRAVDPTVSPSGFVQEDGCNPIPRHGFQSACTSPRSHACSVGTDDATPPPAGIFAAFAAVVAGGGAIRRRPRRSRAARG